MITADPTAATAFDMTRTLDSDPRRVTKTGSAQTSDPAADPAADPAGSPSTAQE